MEAARQGRLQEAELLFAKAVEGTTNLDILDAAAQFYRQRGQVDSATELVARHAALAQDRMVAARHLIAVLPLDMMNYMVEQMIEQLFTGQPPEFAQEFRAIAEEVFAPSRLEAVLQDLYSRHYTAAEMLALARAFASAEGHAAQRKTPVVTLEMMNWGGREFERVAEERQRRREADTFEAAEPPKRIG
jgi:hypothetical protein